MSAARPWFRSERIRAAASGVAGTIIPPSPVVICLFA